MFTDVEESGTYKDWFINRLLVQSERKNLCDFNKNDVHFLITS
jgi:hypothetical protein